MEQGEIGVREAVRDTLARCTHAGDRGRLAEVAACFTFDGVLDVGRHGGRWVGRDRIRSQLEAVVARTAAAGGGVGPVRHHVSSLVLDPVSPTEVVAASYFLVLTGIGVDHWGRYRDRLVLDGGRWLLAERVVRVDGQSDGSLMVPG